jgi:predicted dehydrogenase
MGAQAVNRKEQEVGDDAVEGDTKIDWLLVGTGDISKKRVAPALAAAKPGRILGVCDIVEERANEIAKEFAAEEVFTDLDEALVKTGANCVYLATPVSLHASQTVKTLEAGKHVLVEKPLGLSGGEAQQVVEAAKDKGLRAGCAYFRRCSPRYEQAERMLADEEFGKVVMVRMIYFSWFNPSQDDPKYWRVVRSKSGGGPLSDMGSHMFDVFIGLFGMPKSVYAKCANLVHKWDVEDSAVIIMTLENDAQVIAGFSWGSKTWSHEFEIIGTEAKIKWHPYDTGPVIKTVGRNTQELDLPNAENVHQPLVEDFIKAVLDDSEPVVPPAEAAKTNLLLDGIYKSAESGREIPL